MVANPHFTRPPKSKQVKQDVTVISPNTPNDRNHMHFLKTVKHMGKVTGWAGLGSLTFRWTDLSAYAESRSFLFFENNTIVNIINIY